ncbi:helix-turn-helix transcriptional regulator [Methylorubrum thiocyanatum]|uniref:helix-turn-helix transcriptional regulator n=1 Tax=Methylorubrum thiocyanatum TaxID=47958 RepID=UPI0035C86A07
MTQATSNPKAVVRFTDVARELGLSAPTLRRICKAGKGPRLLQLSTRCYGVRRGDLDAWLESRDVLPPQVQC